MKLKKLKKTFKLQNNITIKSVCDIYLDKDEQVTFKYKSSQYDICKKNWGYYATPSINNRLLKFKFRTFIVCNKKNNLYINLVHSDKMSQFKKYLKQEKSFVVKELTKNENV